MQGWNEHAGMKIAKLHGPLAAGSRITTKRVGLPSSTSAITVSSRRACSRTKIWLPAFMVSLSTAEPHDDGTRLVEIVPLTGPLSGVVGRVLDRRPQSCGCP